MIPAPPYELAQPMETAPKDGRKVLIRFEHVNYRVARPDDRANWEAVIEAEWINFNGGGWTWYGLCGRATCRWPMEMAA